MNVNLDRLLTIKDAADLVSVSERTIRAWIKTGKLVGYGIHGERTLRVSEREVVSHVRPIPHNSPILGNRLAGADRNGVVMTARNTDSSTSHQSAAKVGELAAKLRDRIKVVTHAAAHVGITISEATAQLPEYKPQSVSPRFAELVKSGVLVRVLLGHGKPAKRCPGGVPHYATRFDPETERNVAIHWLPEFAPSAQDAAGANGQPELPEAV